MNHQNRGMFIIINNKKFQPHTRQGERTGTDVDAANLYRLETISVVKLNSKFYRVKEADLFKSNGPSWTENYHIRLESDDFLILGHEEVPLGYFSKKCLFVPNDLLWAYSTIICNHLQKFQKFKNSSLFWWPKSMALKNKTRRRSTLIKMYFELSQWYFLQWKLCETLIVGCQVLKKRLINYKEV